MKALFLHIFKTLFLFTLLSFLWTSAEAGPRLRRICASKDGTNTIFWFPYQNSGCTFLKIRIYARKDKFSTFQKIDSINTEGSTSYSHAAAVTYQKGAYFIEYVYDCGTRKSFYSDTLDVDVFSPDILDPDSVSVGPNGEIYIGWNPEQAKDTKSYIIYRTINGNNYPIDTVFGINNTFYTDTTFGDPSKGPQLYKLAAQDSCDNIAPIGNYHQTVFLQLSEDTCKGEIYLNWSPYIGWKAGVLRYDIYMSEDGNSYKTIDQTKGTSYTFNGGETKKTYFFYVRAVRSDKQTTTSSSNRLSIFTNFGTPLDFVYIRTVTADQAALRIDWAVSDIKGVVKFDIYRGIANPFTSKKYTTVNSSGSELASFTDYNADPAVNIYYYKIVAINSCGQEIGSSNVSNNILLRLVKAPSGTVLNWNAYEKWYGGVDEYDVYRTTHNEGSAWEMVAQLSGNVLSYTDLDSFGEYGKQGICYYIKAIEGDTNKFGFKDTTVSNLACRIDPPVFWMPNAFTPAEKGNKVFKPITLHVDTFASTLIIFNRWGERVFETNKVSSGWDGTMPNGNIAPSGVYLYVVRLVGYDGSVHNMKGLFSLL